MTDIFYNISKKNKGKLLKLLEANTFYFQKDNVILSTVKSENILGIVTKGCVQIIRTDYNGNRTIIEELTENMVFGTSISALSNNEYDIVTKEETKVMIIDYDRIINESQSNTQYYNQFIKNLLDIITNLMAEKNERIEILTKKTTRDKLLEYFNMLSRKNGSKHIYLPFSFTDLSDFLSVDRSAMSREMKYLKEEGFIDVSGKRITLLYR